MEAMRSLEKSYWRKQYASKFSESLETRESEGGETTGHPVCAGLQTATQQKKFYYIIVR